MSAFTNAIDVHQAPRRVPGICRVLGCSNVLDHDETICPDCFSESAETVSYALCSHLRDPNMRIARMALLRYRTARDKDLAWYSQQIPGAKPLSILEANHLREVTCAAAARMGEPRKPMPSQRIDLGIVPMREKSSRLSRLMLPALAVALVGWVILLAHLHITIPRPAPPAADDQVTCATE